jgi:hypothetical protein
MMKNRSGYTKWILLLVVAGSIGLWGACGLLEAASSITIGPFTQSFPIALDANGLKSQIETQIGQPIPGNTLPPGINVTIPLPIPAQQVDLSTRSELKDYKNQLNKIKSVEVTVINLNAESNSLTFELPAADLYLGDLNVTDIDGAKKFAVTPKIPAGSTGVNAIQFTTDGRKTLSDFMLELKFAFLGQVNVVINSDTNNTIPAGVLSGQVQIGVKFTVDPL